METVRVDKWLWATRFFKSRQLAQDAVQGGKVTMAGLRIKPSKMLKCNDSLAIRRGHYLYEVSVLGLVDKRVSAKIANTLYVESEESISNRESLAMQLKSQSLYTPKTDKRPDKKSRRLLINIKKS